MKPLWTVLVMVSMLYSSEVKKNSGALTLNEAIELVKQENLEVKVAEFDRRAAGEDADMAWGNHFGKLDFTQDIARTNDAGNAFFFTLTAREANFGDFGFADFLAWQQSGMQGDVLTIEPHDLNYPEDTNFFQSKLSYQLPIFTGGKITNYTEIARAVEKIKSLDKADVINEKIYQTRKSFYDMALIQSSLKHMQTILANVMTIENSVHEMFKEGYAKEVDLLEIKAKKSDIERMIGELQANEKLLYHYLSFLLNRKVTTIVPPDQELPMPEVSDEIVLANNLDIKKAKTGLMIHDRLLSVARAGYLPEVGAYGEVATADDTFLGDASDHKAYTVSARLSWNIFNGGIDASRSEKAKVEQLKMRTQVDLAERGITLQLAQIRTDIATVDMQIKSLTNELNLADQIAANYEGRYQEGLASMNDVVIKQSAQIEKILALQAAKNKRNERIFALEDLANGVQQ